MAFVKLDTGILNSTLWVERECRELFITALLMAEPQEFLSETPQIAVRSLETTGWMVPPGWYGFVAAAGVGIIRRAIMDQDLGMVALDRLCSPDPESRSGDYEGRRMARIEGGYVVLNYMKYRERDYTAAERQRRYRLKKLNQASTSVNTVTRNDVELRRDITQAEVEVEVEVEVKKKEEKKSARKRATPLPADFKISERVKTWADAKGLTDLGPDLEFFVGRMRANGKTYVDWDEAFMNCVREDWAGLRKGAKQVVSEKKKCAKCGSEKWSGLTQTSGGLICERCR